MARRKEAHSIGGWFQNQLWNTSLLWLLGMAAGGAYFYWDTSVTQRQHSAMLAALKAEAAENKKEEKSERDKVRDAFLADSKAQTAGISELNKQTAVMSAALVSMQRELEKIGTKLDAATQTRRR